MKRTFAVLLSLAILFPFAATSPVADADYLPPRPVQAVGAATSGEITYYPILIRYVGPTTGGTPDGGTVTVDASTGDITLKTGPVASSAADTTTECPASGAAGGVIDVSNAACDTFGEVVDAINASTNWRAVIQDGLRSDTSINTLYTLAETSASLPQGLALAGDGDVSLKEVLALAPVRNDIRFYLQGSGDNKLNPNPFKDSQTEFMYAFFDQTNGTTQVFTVYSVAVNNRPSGPYVDGTAASITSGGASETANVIYRVTGSGAEAAHNFINNPLPSMFTTPASYGTGFVGGGQKILVEAVGGTSHDTLVALSASGRFYPGAR